MADVPQRRNAGGELVPPSTIESGFLRLPLDQDQFKDFIKGLLGRPQTISRQIAGPFDIEFTDIQSLDQLLWQRISQQNGGALVQFNGRLVFNDNSTVELNSLNELTSYNEVRPVFCTGLHLRWDYLLQFPDRKTPEKQGITVSYMTGRFAPAHFGEESHEMAFILGKEGSQGVIQLRIEHTARTWGADIEALLTGFLRSQIRPERAFRKLIRIYQAPISIGVAVLFFMVVTLGLYFTTARYADARIAELKTVVASKADVIQYIGQMVASGLWTQYSFAAVVFLVIAIFVAIWLGVWTGTAADSPPPSFLLLTKESRNRKTAVLRKLERQWLSFCASVATALVLGVLSNWIFNWLFGATH